METKQTEDPRQPEIEKEETVDAKGSEEIFISERQQSTTHNSYAIQVAASCYS